jgi:transcriptional regulator with XRE-family HTH domain
MSDVLVCADPEIREEAAAFVSRLGARPQVYSTRALKSWHVKNKGIVIYLKGPEHSSTLRSCLRQVSNHHSIDVVVYTHTHPSDDHQAAELGKIVGECRPRRTYICFDSDEVQEIFQARIGVGGKEKEKQETSHETVGRLREALHLTQVDLAAALDVTTRTIQNWEKHGRASERRLRDLKELHELVAKYIGVGQVAAWMDGANDAFQKRTPREMIREGKTRDLILEFHRLQTGERL